MRLFHLKLHLLPILFFVLTSCHQDEFIEEISVDLKNRNTTNFTCDSTIIFDVDHYFDSIHSPENWRSYNSMDERLAALNLPDSVLHNLSTETLVYACVTYPFNFTIIGYEDGVTGANTIINWFNGFKELSSRGNFHDYFVDYYISGDEILGQYSGRTTYSKVPRRYAEMFMESIFLTDFFRNSAPYQTLSRIVDEVYKKLNDQEGASGFVLSQKKQIIEQLCSFKNICGLQMYDPEVIGGGVVYTPFGQEIYYDDMAPMTEEDAQRLDFVYTNEYAEAELLEHSTGSYNCHYYAWCGINGRERHWINYVVIGDKPNVSKFWTNDEYRVCTSGDIVDKVCYTPYMGYDHSMVKESRTGNMYISKWGYGPLMRHKFDEHPFRNLPYCIKLTKINSSGYLNTSYDNNATYVDRRDTYSVPSNVVLPDHLKYSVSILNGKDNDAVENGSAIYSKINTNSFSIVFKKPGIYYIHFRGVGSNGKTYIDYQYEASVEP